MTYKTDKTKYDGERGAYQPRHVEGVRKFALVGLAAIALSAAAGCIIIEPLGPPGPGPWHPGPWHPGPPHPFFHP